MGVGVAVAVSVGMRVSVGNGVEVLVGSGVSVGVAGGMVTLGVVVAGDEVERSVQLVSTRASAVGTNRMIFEYIS